LIELDKKVFGNMMTKEIIGSEPPIAEIKNIFEKELENLLQKLESITIDDLEDLLEQQKICKKHINTRPGAMALDQPKIQMFNVYNDKYLEKINEKFT
jgi:tetrahydromethanopterin S-methyltransferase subunit A